nr:SURF1 family protein [uncultured Sphingomonas sp.]
MSQARGKRVLLIALCATLALLFAGLGVWQVERLGWKRDLIARVEARVKAPPVPLGPRDQRSSFTPGEAEYRRVVVTGRYDHASETLVDALTERGKGFWVLTPLVTSDRTILINRGFVPTALSDPSRRQTNQIGGNVEVTGLMRLTEPGGRFLRANVPAEDRWYSRDVEAIARKRGIPQVEPFFIDAEASPEPGGHPIGGLTVIRFPNNHLIYALTWFGLAALCMFGLALTLRSTHIRG